MHERPQAALFKALRELGYRVEAEQGNDKLPVKIFAGSSRGNEAQTEKTESRKQKAEIDQSHLTSAATNQRKCTVSIEESSQFASALFLCAKTGGWQVEVVGENADESPYVAMTGELISEFPKTGGIFQIELDASSGSYFWAASCLQGKISNPGSSELVVSKWPKLKSFQNSLSVEAKRKMAAGELFITWLRPRHLQIDTYFTDFLPFPQKISRQTDLGDSIMTAIVLAPFASQPVKFTDLGRLRVQECERVVALRTELTKCGAKVVEEGDTLTVYPSPLHGAEIETYNDHRMAMCFAILGLKVPGIKIKNPACVKKTFPNFFQKLAAPPPHGLGATILDAKSGRKLTHEELFAD